jgi:hypothetical protein
LCCKVIHVQTLNQAILIKDATKTNRLEQKKKATTKTKEENTGQFLVKCLPSSSKFCRSGECRPVPMKEWRGE